MILKENCYGRAWLAPRINDQAANEPALASRMAVLPVDGCLGAHLVGQKQPPWAGSDRWSLGGPRAALEVHSRNHHTFISRTDCSVTAQNQGPAPRSAMIRSITVQCRARRVSHPHGQTAFSTDEPTGLDEPEARTSSAHVR